MRAARADLCVTGEAGPRLPQAPDSQQKLIVDARAQGVAHACRGRQTPRDRQECTCVCIPPPVHVLCEPLSVGNWLLTNAIPQCGGDTISAGRPQKVLTLSWRQTPCWL